MNAPPHRFFSELEIIVITILELLSKYFLNVDGSISMRIEPCSLSVFEFIQSEELEPES